MKAEPVEFPDWTKKEIIGFNIGFLQQENEKYFDLLLENYINAIEKVIEETRYDVALIPHVNWSYKLTDFTTLDQIYKKIKHTKRVFLIEEHSAPVFGKIGTAQRVSKKWAPERRKKGAIVSTDQTRYSLGALHPKELKERCYEWLK